jgi:hypothetical protein
MKKIGYLIIAWLAMGTLTGITCSFTSGKVLSGLAFGYLGTAAIGLTVAIVIWALEKAEL